MSGEGRNNVMLILTRRSVLGLGLGSSLQARHRRDAPPVITVEDEVKRLVSAMHHSCGSATSY